MTSMDTRLAEHWSLVAALILFCVSSVLGEIRCYCNQAACVSTGYMCKSRHLCFSDEGSGLHGCLERRRCEGLRCCAEDMCNYRHFDRPYDADAMPGAFEDEPESAKMALMESALNREVWFKAAVIAVPIGGLCILALLALAAARMLRQDAVRQRRILELRRIYGYSLRDSLLSWNKAKDSTIV